MFKEMYFGKHIFIWIMVTFFILLLSSYPCYILTNIVFYNTYLANSSNEALVIKGYYSIYSLFYVGSYFIVKMFIDGHIIEYRYAN